MIPRLARLLRHDQTAAVAPFVAAFGAVLVGAAGFALDAASYYTANRNLRAVTEAAALAAAQNPAQATARARNWLQSNGYHPAILQSVEVGRYCPDASLAPTQRFDPSLSRCPGDGRANAVRIRTGKPSRQYLTRMLGPANPIPALAATATAARIDEAGVGITSGILTVTNPLVTSVNDLLGGLLGIKLRLSTADIEALMGGDIDAGLFFDALARRVGETGTYADLTRRNVPLSDILHAAASAAPNSTTAATLTLVAGQVGSGYMVPLTSLFGLGVWKNMPVGEADAKPALRAGLNAYQLFSFAVQAGNGTIDLSDAVGAVAPGGTVRLAGLATGPMDRPRFSFGPAGETTVGTSAIRLQLNVGLGALLGDPLTILIDIAAGRADVTAIDCPDTAEQARDTRVSVQAQTGLVNAYIGKPRSGLDAMARPMPPISAADIVPIRLDVLGLSLVTVDARAVAQPVMGNSGTLRFGPGGPGTVGKPSAPGTPVSIGNGSQVGPLLGSLTASLTNSLDVRIIGLCLPIVCDATRSAALTLLTNTLITPLGTLIGTVIDPLVDNLLAALGVRLGHATVWVTGARCGVPVLV